MSRLPKWLWLVIAVVLAGGVLWLVQTCYSERLTDAERERNNALADADSLREVAGGWEQRARTAEKEKELLARVSEELQNELRRTNRRLRAVADLVAEIADVVDVDTQAVARGDSTQIRWAHADSVVNLAVALAFPGMIRPDPEPRVTGTAEFSARVAAQIALSCEPDTGAPFANATVLDDRVAITALDVAVDDRVSCLEPPSWTPLSLDLKPNAPWFVVGAAAGYLFGRR